MVESSAADGWGVSVGVRRRALGITQAALARRVDSTPGSISGLECGGICGREFRARIEAALAEGPARAGEGPGKRGCKTGWRRGIRHGRAELAARFRSGRRKCLCCGLHFDSSWCGERMCQSCKDAA